MNNPYKETALILAAVAILVAVGWLALPFTEEVPEDVTYTDIPACTSVVTDVRSVRENAERVWITVYTNIAGHDVYLECAVWDDDIIQGSTDSIRLKYRRKHVCGKVWYRVFSERGELLATYQVGVTGERL